MSVIEKRDAEAVETIIIGIIAKNMGAANQSNVVAAGKEVAEFMGKMTFTQLCNFRRINRRKETPVSKKPVCPKCGSSKVIMFTADDDLCQTCNNWFPTVISSKR